MLITYLILVLISNALTLSKEKGILYSRSIISGMIYIFYMAYNGLYIDALHYGLSVYNGLFNINLLSQSFNIFIFILTGTIAALTSFYPRKIEEHKNILLSFNKTYDEYVNSNKNSRQYNIIEYTLIVLFIITGAVLLMSTSDLISLFLSIELQSYGLYILATLYRDSESSTGSALTYFLLGGLSSCFILLGSSVLYVNSGTTNLDNIYIINNISEINNYIDYINEVSDISLSFNTSYKINYINISFIVLTVGLLFKISAAPFHFWSPDVYDGIPTIVTTFVAIIAKISLFVLLLELVTHTNIEEYITYNNTESNNMNTLYTNFEWKKILIYSSLMSLIIGSVLGLTQYRIKRLFAYSTISHVGFILLALSINKIESIQGYIFYILQYSISNLNTFFILVLIGYTLYGFIYEKNKNTWSRKLIDEKNSPIQLLNQIKGYFYINSFLAISFTITIFSFIGIPPLIGFFAKQMILSAALDKGFIFMTFVGIITSVIGAAYYLNIVKLIFFNKSDYVYKNEFGIELSRSKTYINSYLVIIVSILTMLISLFIFIPSEWFKIVSILSLSISNI